MPSESEQAQPHNAERPVEALLEAARTALDDLHLGIRLDPAAKPARRNLTASEVVNRARQRRARDGYPRRSLAGGRPASVVDERGVPMPPLADPVGELVVAEDETDPVRDQAHKVLRHLHRAAGELSAAVGAVHKVAKMMGAQTATPPDEIWCRSHLRFGMFEPVAATGRDGRCDWCYRFWLAEGADPPQPLLDRRAQGKKILARDIDEALKRPRRNPDRPRRQRQNVRR